MDFSVIFESSILHPLFWIIMGGLMILFFIGAGYWLKDAGVLMNWWKWVQWSFALLFLLTAVAINNPGLAQYGVFGVFSS